MKSIVLFFSILYMIYTPSKAQSIHDDDKLIPVVELGEYRAIGVAVSSENRLFVSFPRRGGAYRYGLAEIVNGAQIPYPDLQWNQDGDRSSSFVSLQDLYIDHQDKLWVLDSKPSSGGSIFGSNEGEVEDGYFKLLKIDLKNDSIERIYTFDDLDLKKSGLNDIRVDTEKGLAYFSDPGQAAIVIMDLTTGKTRKVLERTECTLADPNIILRYHGNDMQDKSGKPFSSNINGIALTKDFKFFYFKPINKEELYRIETVYLADTSISETELQSKVENMGKVGVTHGLETDRKGNVFLTTSLDYSIKYLSPDGHLHTLVQDDRLLWPDSFGIGTDGYLYFSCAQLQYEAQWNNGVDKSILPFTLYKVRLP